MRCVSAFLLKASLKIYEPTMQHVFLNYRTMMKSAAITKTFDENNDIFTVSFLKSE